MHCSPRVRSLTTAVTVALVLAAAGCGGGGGHARARAKAPVTTTTSSTPPSSTTAAPVVNVYAHTTPGDLSPAVAGVPTRVYVPNSQSNTVDVIDPATFQVVDHFATGGLPQHVVPSWDLKTLYVNNNTGNSLTPIDPRTAKPGPRIPIEDPYNLYFTPDGTKAVVMAERNSEIDFRDPHTWKLVKGLHIPHRGVNHADFSADGSTMFASTEFSGFVVRVDLASMELTGEVQVGGKPVDVKLSPDGKLIYVANETRNGVSVIDPSAMKEVGFIPTGSGTHGLYPSRDATNLYATNRTGGSISVISFATRAVIATWPIGGSPDMGGVSTDGTQLWLSGRYNSEVYVIDTTTGQRIHTIKVGAGPHGLCLFPQPGRYSMGHTGNYR